MKWFSIIFWKYLLEKSSNRSTGYCSWWERIRCRAKGHPEGPWYYNVGGCEPDMHCKNCGDDIG